MAEAATQQTPPANTGGDAPAKPVIRSTGTKPTPATNQADLSPQARWQG